MKTTASIDVLPIFQAFSEPYRLQVIELLRDRELCACDIANHLGISASKLSFHLKTLREAGLIQGRQEGRWIYYRLNLAQFFVLEEYISEFRRLSPILPARSCPE
ncbi:MAG: metalloregulator ArsR/SmtB family transcription factor [Cyanobacteria bacterium P01_F01_bin.13]